MHDVACKFACTVRMRSKAQPNDRKMPTQHVATLLGATCCVRLATVLRCVATCWVLSAQIWKWSNLSQQHPTCRNTSQVIILFAQCSRYLYYFSSQMNTMYWWFCSFITEVCYKKLTMQRTQHFSAFVCYRKNPVKCSACLVSLKNCDWVKNWLLGDTAASRRIVWHIRDIYGYNGAKFERPRQQRARHYKEKWPNRQRSPCLLFCHALTI